jgi:hypothetical protein
MMGAPPQVSWARLPWRIAISECSSAAAFSSPGRSFRMSSKHQSAHSQCHPHLWDRFPSSSRTFKAPSPPPCSSEYLKLTWPSNQKLSWRSSVQTWAPWWPPSSAGDPAFRWPCHHEDASSYLRQLNQIINVSSTYHP